MSKAIQNALDEYLNGKMPEILVLAKVTYTLDDGPWCHATDAEGNEYFEIRLQPQLLNGSQTFTIPKVDSWILVGSIRGKAEYICLMVTEIDYIHMIVDGCRFIIRDSGFVIKKGSESLAGLIGELIDATVALTVTCASPGSPSSPPINAATFTALKTRFNDLLKTG